MKTYEIYTVHPLDLEKVRDYLKDAGLDIAVQTLDIVIARAWERVIKEGSRGHEEHEAYIEKQEEMFGDLKEENKL